MQSLAHSWAAKFKILRNFLNWTRFCIQNLCSSFLCFLLEARSLLVNSDRRLVTTTEWKLSFLAEISDSAIASSRLHQKRARAHLILKVTIWVYWHLLWVWASFIVIYSGLKNALIAGRSDSYFGSLHIAYFLTPSENRIFYRQIIILFKNR